MGRNRMAAKLCPSCDQQVPVACKTCPCGFSFFAQKKSELEELRKSESSREGGETDEKKDNAEEENKPRRTERTKRVRPDFYNSVEIDKQTRKQHVKRRRTLTAPGAINIKRKRAVMLRNANRQPSKSTSMLDMDQDYPSDNEDDSGDDGTPRKKRGRPKYNKDKNGSVSEEAAYDNLSVEKVFQYSVILADINRKICVGQSMNRSNVAELTTSPSSKA